MTKRRREILKIILKQIITSMGQIFLNSPFLIRCVNFTYEHANHSLRNLFVRAISYAGEPQKDFIWTLYLSNGITLQVPVMVDDLKSWQFAQSYQWHDRGLKYIEEFLHSTIPLHHVFLDIGANLGLRSLYPLSIGRPVYLFEPNSSLRPFSEKVFHMNKLSNFKIENICLGDKEGTVNFYISRSSYLSSVIEQQAQLDGITEKIDIPMMKLDTYLRENLQNIKIGLLKIDVEGLEQEVLSGAINCLKDYQPAVMVEVKSLNRDIIFDLFEELNYIGFAISNILPKPLLELDKMRRYIPGIENYLYCSKQNRKDIIFNLRREFCREI